MTLTKTTEKQIEKLAGQAQEGFLDNLTGAFFRRIDWWAFWIVLIGALAVYFFTLAPTLTLEDSGELAVASDYLGVPHPPGYPIWTLMTWFFQWVFHWVTYHGHPNPAWSVGLASAVSGAGACALLALLISRSGADLLRSVPVLTDKIGFQTENLLCLVAGISGGLLLAFSPVLWSQSVIVEVYGLNAFFQMAVLLLIYMWMCRPKSDTLLFVAAFLFGLGLTNHQTLLFLGLALVVAVLLKDANLFRDFAIAAVLLGVVFLFAAKGYTLFATAAQKAAPGFDPNVWKWSVGPSSTAFWVYNILFVAIPIALVFMLPHGKTVCATILLAELGVAFYMYLPLASEQNPPMNWGYPRTWEGFMHAVTRGQYEAIVPTDIFSEKFIQQLGSYLSDLRSQFSLPIAVLGFLPFCAWGLNLRGKRRSAFPAALALFLASSLLILLETAGWAGAEKVYRVLLAPILLMAGWGFLTLIALYLKKQLADLREYPLGTRMMIWGFFAAVALAALWVDVMSLKALFGGTLSGVGKAIFAGVVIGPPLAIALAWWLSGARYKLDFDLGVSQQKWLITSVVGFFSVSVIFLVFQNPQLDIQNLFIGRVQFIQSHALYALWLGYGLLLSMAWLEKTGAKHLIVSCCAAVVLVILWVDVISLKAILGAGNAFYFSLVFGPLVAMPLAWLLSGPRFGFKFSISVRWLFVSAIGLFAISIFSYLFETPRFFELLDNDSLEFIPSQAIRKLWIGYGILLLIVWLEKIFGRKALLLPAMLASLLLPGILLWQNGYDEEQLRIVGGAEQHGHDYGWQFGNWSLQGVEGIQEDFHYKYPDEKEFAAQWGAYTNAIPADYPPPMTPGAIFYGGTDPGRFVPTYMIYSARVRPDVYLITQNALADNTFMNITRDLYGDTIYIPSLEDSNEAFRKYVDDVNKGVIQAGADIKIENGKVSVQGVGGVMTINGILAELIFKENKAKHDFYVEESYVIGWMYPYLTPNGIIMKLNGERVENLDPKLVENDHKFWGWYTQWLLDQSAFRRDICARKSFSKLRSAIAGIYDYRHMYDEAEYAFKQSIDLYPLSPEANFRLAQMYMNTQRFKDAQKLILDFGAQDPQNDSAKGFLNQIENTRHMIARRQEIENKQRESNVLSADEALELVSIYRASGMQGAYQQLASRLISDSNLPPQHLLSLAGLFAQDQRVDALAYALEQYTKRETGNLDVWLDLAAAYAFLRRDADAIKTARRAIELGGDQAREVILHDQRFQALASNREFRALFPRQGMGPSIPAPWQGGPLPNLPGMAR